MAGKPEANNRSLEISALMIDEYIQDEIQFIGLKSNKLLYVVGLTNMIYLYCRPTNLLLNDRLTDSSLISKKNNSIN